MTQIFRDITAIFRHSALYRLEHMTKFNLTGRQALYLSEICTAPGISQDQLAQQLCIDKSNAARQVAALEEKGYITRTNSPKDKRIICLRPTEKTMEILPKLNGILQSWDYHLESALTDEEKETLSALLSKVKAQAAGWKEVKQLVQDP